MSEITYKEYRDFPASLRNLYHRGGQFTKAAERILALQARISNGYDEPFKELKTTNYGENRIEKCIKYDLPGASRLVTIKNKGIVLLCFVGTHKDCDKWIKKKTGFKPAIDKNGAVIDAYISKDISDEENRVTGQTGLTQGKLFEKIDEDDLELLFDGLDRKVMRKLEELESINSDDDIYSIVKIISTVDQSNAIYDVFSLLRQDREEEAKKALKIYTGEIKDVDDVDEDDITYASDSEVIKTIPLDSPHYIELLEHYVTTAGYMDWMLFLHPSQEEIVVKDFNGPSKLVGVSGSGKTCVVVKRAIRLAEKYENEKILILTLNRPLAKLIHDLVNTAARPSVRGQITVLPFFNLCQKLLHKFEPENDRLYDDITWKSKEHIDEVWREYYRCELNNKDASVMIPVHDSLIGRGIYSEEYIREEFDWIRSTIPGKERDIYYSLMRKGRSYALDKNYRKLILKGLDCWEKKMKAVGITDYLGLATALDTHLEKIEPMYRCVLVDESQDFGTSELAIVRKLVDEGENDLFLCGDAAQQVSAKNQSFKDADISVQSARSFQIKKNYRNSKEILKAAYSVLDNNLSEEMLGNENFEVLDPEYANFSGPEPLILKADTLVEEISYAYSFLKEYMDGNVERKGCLVICGYSLYEIQKYGKKNNIPVLDGEITIERSDIFLSDLEQTKGFEFDVVCIVNCNNSVIPDGQKPELEQFRDLARFYVAMTRAKNQLVITFSSSKSSLLDSTDNYFLDEDWNSYHDGEISPLGVPMTLESIRNDDTEYHGDHKLSGPQYLYKDDAIGLPMLLINKLRKVVSGTSTRRNNIPVEWRTIGEAIKDTKQYPQSSQQFGPEGIKIFKEFYDKLNDYE